MAKVYVKDPGGAILHYRVYGNISRSSHIPAQCVEDTHRIPLLADDVIFCSYPKSGCHWLWEMTRMLALGSTEQHCTSIKQSFQLEYITVDQSRQLLPPRVFNGHLRFSEIPEDFSQFHNKIVYVYRNPKDVAVSFYNMLVNLPHLFQYYGQFNDFVELFMTGNIQYGSYFDFMRDWDEEIKKRSSSIPIHVVSYEDMHKDRFGEMRRLCQFLGKEHSDEFLERVGEACTLESMRSRKGGAWEMNSGGNAIYRKGVVGDWKNYFNVARNEQMDRLIQDKLSDVQFNFRFE